MSIKTHSKALNSDAYSVTYPSHTQTWAQTGLTTLSHIGTRISHVFSPTFFSRDDFTESKKNALLEMGIDNPENFYQTNQKTANLAVRLFELFTERDLHLTYDLETKKLIAYDSCFSDIKKIRKVFSQKYPWDYFPTFHIENQTFCSTLKNFETTFSDSPFTPSKSSKLLKQSPRLLPGALDFISLPSGKICSQKDFIEHPFFKYTIEKYNVFRFLTSFVKKDDFQTRYNDFLENCTKEDWISFYAQDPKSLACLSILAFLEGQIKPEDLFVMHMAASALEEASEKEPVTFYVLTAENAGDYLEQAQYPLFAPTSFYEDKTGEESNTSCLKFIANLANKTPVQRTAITYTTLYHSFFGSIENSIFSTGWKIGYQNKESATNTPSIALLPPFLCLELYEAASSLEVPPPSSHTWMFGYNNGKTSLEDLEVGRPISIASPLFKLPYVHGRLSGKQLGITMHDLLYHIAIDWKNPHTREFIQLGKALLNLPHQTKDTKTIGIHLLDREASGYSSLKFTLSPPNRQAEKIIIFWTTLATLVTRTSTSSDFYNQFFPILQSVLPPDFLNVKLISKLLTEMTATDFSKILFLMDLKTKIKDLQAQKPGKHLTSSPQTLKKGEFHEH